MAAYIIHRNTPRFIFLVSLKVMYSSLCRMLRQHFPDAEFQYSGELLNSGLLTEIDLSSFTLFGIVRDPYTRIQSLYADKCFPGRGMDPDRRPFVLQHSQYELLDAWRHLNGSHIEILRPGQVFQPEDKIQRRRFAQHRELLESLSFSDFVGLVRFLLVEKERTDGHFWPQAETFRLQRFGLPLGIDEVLSVAHLFKLEDIASAWPVICGLLHTDIDLKRQNATRNKARDLASDPEVAGIVAEIYRDDYQWFGYRPRV